MFVYLGEKFKMHIAVVVIFVIVIMVPRVSVSMSMNEPTCTEYYQKNVYIANVAPSHHVWITVSAISHGWLLALSLLLVLVVGESCF